MPFKKIIKKLFRSSKDQPSTSTELMETDSGQTTNESSETDIDFEPERFKKLKHAESVKKYRKTKEDNTNPERQQRHRRQHPGEDTTNPERQERHRRQHPGEDTTNPERQRGYRRQHPGEDKTNPERQRRYRRQHRDSDPHTGRQSRHHRTIRSQERDSSVSSELDLTVADLPEEHYLGERNNICPCCGALHFRGVHMCCNKGKIFIPPFRKFPEPLYSLYYNLYSPEHNRFMSNVLGYNNLFSFASISYNRVQVAPFGVQAAKMQGTIRHFPSAIRPNNPNYPHYGNFYIYDARKAAEERIQSQYFNNSMDPSVVLSIGECMARVNPLAKIYKTMNEVMKCEEQRGMDPSQIRLKIVDPYSFQKQEKELQAHPGVYGTGNYGDYVCIFYSCDVEQQIKSPGLTIYPRLGNSIPRPIFSWMKEVNALCYPLIFPFGELGWHWKGHQLMTNPMPYKDRLGQYFEEHPEAMANVDEEIIAFISPEPEQTHSQRNTDLQSEYESLSGEEERNDSILNEEYDEQLVQSIRERGLQREIDDFVTTQERNGEVYPLRKSYSHLRRKVNEPDSDEIDSGSENEAYSEEEHNQPLEQDIHHETNVSMIRRTEEQNVLRTGGSSRNESMIIDETLDERNNDNEEQSIVENRRGRVNVSQREWMLYVSQDRFTDKLQQNRISTTGRVGQVFLIDQCLRILRNRYQEIEKHNTQFRTSTRKKLLDALQRIADLENRQVGCVTSIPVSVVGSPRFLQRKFEEAVAMANMLGPPDLFITFTANMKWKEVQENIPKSYTWADFPFIPNEVFKKKFDDFLMDLLGKPIRVGGCMRNRGSLFGEILWYTFATEFQARGPPHVHLIVSLRHHIRTTQQIDAICKAELPIPEESTNEHEYEWTCRLRKNVEELMVHRPCEMDNEAYCRKEIPKHWQKCRKDFPKEYNDHTQFGDRHYPLLKRRNNGESVDKMTTHGTVTATNRHVVPYNPYLSNKYGCHINLEIISSLKQVKYIFKYLFKGMDRVLVDCIFDLHNGSYPASAEMTFDGNIMHPRNMKIPKGSIMERQAAAIALLHKKGIDSKDKNGEPVLVFNECHQIEDMSLKTTCEAAWDITAYPRYGASHKVVTICVHEPENEPIRMELDQELDEELLADEGKSRLLAWFALNQISEEARQFTLDQIPKFYTYEKGKWKKRKLDWSHRILGHIRSVRPRCMELYAIRLLVKNQRGPTSFEHLRTVDGIVYDTFVDAAKALHLMNSQMEWTLALAEASQLENPTALRRMFGSILIHCAPTNPEELWEMFKEEMYANKDSWDIETKEAHALFHIQSILQYHGLQLETFGLPEVTAINLPAPQYLINDARHSIVSQTEAERMARFKFNTFTMEQKIVCQQILDALNEKKSVFLEGAGGVGKTTVYTWLYYHLTAQNHKVLSTAHTGIAATLLPGGSTVHRAFNVPLDTEEAMTCNVDLESEKANELRNYTVVLWDESTMSDRRIVSCISYLLQTLHGNDAPFGGIPVVFGGNWMQTLPIVDGVDDSDVINYTLKRTNLWPELKQLRLKTNIRARQDPEFANWVQEVGNGQNFVGPQQIEIPQRLLVEREAELIDFVFGNGVLQDTEKCSKSAILTIDNKTALEINEKVINMLEGESHIYTSTDEYDPEKGFREMDPETYNMMTPSGLPPHRLTLKVGAIVILMTNLNVLKGLCNGTKLVVLKTGENFVACKVLNPTPTTPEVVYLHRIALQSTSKMRRDIAFTRWQIPVRLAYALTVNKSQGQTLERVGLLLRTPAFQHGQFYVAISRVRSFSDLKICNLSSKEVTLTRNIVYTDILEDYGD